MKNELGETQTLSRSSDHLGNLANILKDLNGGATLLNELTQNANDAGAHTIRFTANKVQLEAWNSTTFSDCSRQELHTCPWKHEGRRSCDLHSFRQVAGRHKASDNATTGAFGVGFTSVYQVTDHPELVTSGKHLILDESKPEEHRIAVCPGGCSRNHQQPGTTFHLPWARQDTALRRALGAAPLTANDVEALITEMHDGAPSALVFLENLRTLEVLSSTASTVVERSREGSRITLSTNGQPSSWLLLEGNSARAGKLKESYGHTGSDRSANVQVAVPVHGTTIGHIFADLPTETRTGWNGHINGTFFPKQDRKSVEFDTYTFQGKWNDLLIETAAHIVAAKLEVIAATLGEQIAWRYLVDAENINRSISKKKHPVAFGAFFTHVKPVVPQAHIALLADGQRVRPPGTLVLRAGTHHDATAALTTLGLKIVSTSIRSEVYQTTFTQYGMKQLTVQNIVEALTRAGVTKPWKPSPDGTLSSADVEAILRLIESFHDREDLLRGSGAGTVAVVPCVDGTFATARETVDLDAQDRALFELLAPGLPILDRDRLKAWCPSLLGLCEDITPARAIAIFESSVDALAVAPDRVLDWIANHRSALADANTRTRVSALPIFPSTDGRLLPLTALSLPSDFDDVLGVADVIDRSKTTGHEDLLRLLGARELDAVEYLGRHVVPAAHRGDLTPQQAGEVLAMVHRHRADLELERSTHEALAAAPIVVTDQGLKPPTTVHLPNPALRLIDADTPTLADRTTPSHLIETLVWLGVARTPSDTVLSAAAARLGHGEKTPDRDVVLAILNSLPNPPTNSEVPETLQTLTTSAWLPVQGGGKARPREIYSAFQRYLFDSQGPHLDLAVRDQQRLSNALTWLGVPSSPTTAKVIAHLRHCAETGTEVNDRVFQFLSDCKEEQAVRALRDLPSVQIAKGQFVLPGHVFWNDPQLGKWAHHLPPVYRQHQAYYDRVGVQEHPSPEQLEETLRRISRQVGNDWVDDDDQAVLHRCWELLDQKLPKSTAALTRLRTVKSALGPRGILEAPERLFFVDGRRLAETISLMKHNLIHRDRTTRRALVAAGVRAAEDVIEARVALTSAHAPAHDIRKLIENRHHALARLVDAQRTEEAEYDLQPLADLQFDHMRELAVTYVAHFAHYQDAVGPHPADAIYLRENHRLMVRTQIPTRKLARELALLIAPEADVSTLAPSILEILNAEDLDAAMGLLDEYGVRDLDPTSWGVIPSLRADGLDDQPDADGDSDPSADPAETWSSPTSESAGPPERPHAGSGGPPATTAASAPSSSSGTSGDPVHQTHAGSVEQHEPSRRSRTDQRQAPNTSRMTSYVSFHDPSRTPHSRGAEAEKNSAIDRAGVRRVLQYEASCGRNPVEQAHNNPGFDVLSKDENDVVVRRIEVKSIGGPWTDRGVLLSSTQFADAQAHPKLYWLYVVEHALDDDAAVIHRIQDPAGQVTKFGFDRGWQALNEL